MVDGTYYEQPVPISATAGPDAEKGQVTINMSPDMDQGRVHMRKATSSDSDTT